MKDLNESFLNEVVKLIEAGSSAVDSLKGKNLVLMLGNTGAGKSTLINYLNGYRYRKVKLTDGSGRKIAIHRDNDVANAANVANVGHGQISETLYPHIINGFCDLPGVNDNRGDLIRIVTVSTTHLAVQKSESIKSIIVTLDYPSFYANKGQTIQDLVVRLSKIVKGNWKAIQDSVVFVVTKAPSDVTVDGFIKDCIDEKLDNKSVGFIKRHKDKQLNKDEFACMNVFQAIRQNKNKIVVANIFDEGESAKKLKEIIATSESIKPARLNFLTHDFTQEKFNEGVLKIFQECKKRDHDINVDIPEKIKVQEKIVSQAESEVKKLLGEVSCRERLKKESNVRFAEQMAQESTFSQAPASIQPTHVSLSGSALKINYAQNHASINSYKTVMNELSGAIKSKIMVSSQCPEINARAEREVAHAKRVQSLDYEINEKNNLIEKVSARKSESQALIKQYKAERDKLIDIQLENKKLFSLVQRIIEILGLKTKNLIAEKRPDQKFLFANR